jgi:hypothetical protein
MYNRLICATDSSTLRFKRLTQKVYAVMLQDFFESLFLGKVKIVYHNTVFTDVTNLSILNRFQFSRTSNVVPIKNDTFAKHKHIDMSICQSCQSLLSDTMAQ